MLPVSKVGWTRKGTPPFDHRPKEHIMDFIRQTVYVVQFQDLQRTLEHVFGKTLQQTKDLNWSGQVSYELDVDGQLSGWDRADLQAWLDRKQMNMQHRVHVLLNELCRLQMIPRGHYVIRLPPGVDSL